MTSEQFVEYLLSRSPLFDKGVIRDTDRHGNDFCEMIIKNEAQPLFPITVTVTNRGASISVGQIQNVASSSTMSPEETLAAINDIVNDKIIFVIAYDKDNDLGFGSPSLTRIFAITGADDDMSEDYERFLVQIAKPIKKIFRPFTSIKGRFTIFNFTGSLIKTVER